ncbi:MAG: hypothetical protein KatS3mg060_2524 [Dehalococcoidia bacterium]|nr:MAG: hypothetical protein KatS3mg060_2524 [Dehalococcoidia bacterium]
MTADELRRLAAALGIDLLDDEIDADLVELEAMLENARRLRERLTAEDEPGLRPDMP